MTMDNSQTGPVQIAGLAHIGIRVHDLDRSMRFYELLGFTKIAGPIGPEPVAILDHPSGLELNLVLNAAGIPLSGGPVRFGPNAQAIFVRDPDRNVIELHQRG